MPFTAFVLITPLPGHKPITFKVSDLGSSQNLCGPGMRIKKTTKQVNSHGFSRVKTWLLIPCDTAFYAIKYMYVYIQNDINL